MNKKGKILIGAVCSFTVAAVAFLLAPIENKISFKDFYRSKLGKLKKNGDLEATRYNKTDDAVKDESIK